METNSNENVTVQPVKYERAELEKELDQLKLLGVTQLNELEEKIKKDKESLENSLEKLEKKKCPIQKNEYLWGLVQKCDWEKSFLAMYEDIKSVSGSSKDAIKVCNDNMISILGLIRILAVYESELYELMDRSELSNAELANILRDICKDADIKDESIIELFEQASNRAYKLRDRINNLRFEMNEKFSKIEEKFVNLDEFIAGKKEELSSYVENQSGSFLEKCNDEFTNCKRNVDGLINEKIQLLEQLKNKSDELMQHIDNAEKEYEKRISNLEEKLNKEIKSVIESQNMEIATMKNEIQNLQKKGFFDSVFYKVSVGIIAITSILFCVFH